MTRQSSSRQTEKPRLRPALKALFWVGMFVCPLAFICLLAYASNIYPFGAESFLTEDLKFQYIDFYTWFRGVLIGENNLFYSFGQEMGFNTWGLFAYYLASPFNLLVLLFDEQHLTDFAFWMTALKLSCIQVSMGWFLRKRFHLGYAWTWAFALSLTWCSWVTTQLRCPMWLDALIILPVACWLSYRLIRENRFLAFGVTVGISIIACWYTAYMSILFLGVYSVFELLVFRCEGGRVTLRMAGTRAVRFVAAVVIALGLSAWIFVPTVLAMIGWPEALPLGSDLLIGPPADVVRGLLPLGWSNTDTIPQLYAGTIPLVCFAGMLVNRNLAARTRLLILAFEILMIAGTAFTVLEYIWCGMRTPFGFYSRVAVFAAFVLVWGAAYSVSKGWQAPWKKPAVLIHRRPAAQACTRKALAGALSVLLVCFCAVDLFANARNCWSILYRDYPQSYHESYVQDAGAQIAALEASDPSPFYRTEKTSGRAFAALNEGMAYGYRQISSYSSAGDADAILFLNSVGYSSEGEFSTHYSPNLAMDSLLGVKYADAPSLPEGFVETGLPATSTGLSFYRNPYALSLGYRTSTDVVDSTLAEATNPFERINAIYSAIAGRQVELFRPLVSQQVETAPAELSWNVEVPADVLPYCYVVTEGDTRFSPILLSVDGAAPIEEASRFEHSVRPLGALSQTKTQHSVTLGAPVVGDYAGTMPPGTTCLMYGLDMQAFEEIIASLKETQFEPTAVGDGYVEGTVAFDEPGTLLFSIPLDPGWVVTVDGEPVELQSAFDDGMSALELEAGIHAVKMTYLPPGLIPGAAGTLATVIALAIIGCRRHPSKLRR